MQWLTVFPPSYAAVRGEVALPRIMRSGAPERQGGERGRVICTPGWKNRICFRQTDILLLIALMLGAPATASADSAAAQAHIDAGVALIERGKDEGAEREFRAAVDADPQLAKAHYNLGVVLHRQNRNTEAEEELRAAVRHNPDHAKAHYYLGKILAAAQKRDEAAAELQSAARLDPSLTAARAALSTLEEGSAKGSTADDPAAGTDANTDAPLDGTTQRALRDFLDSMSAEEWFETTADILDVMWCRKGGGVCVTSLGEWIRTERRGFLLRRSLAKIPAGIDQSTVLREALRKGVSDISHRIRAEVRFINSGENKLASLEGRASSGLYEHTSALERAEGSLRPKIEVIGDDLMRLQQLLCGWGCMRIASPTFKDGRSVVVFSEEELTAAVERLPAKIEAEAVPVLIEAAQKSGETSGER